MKIFFGAKLGYGAVRQLTTLVFETKGSKENNYFLIVAIMLTRSNHKNKKELTTVGVRRGKHEFFKKWSYESGVGVFLNSLKARYGPSGHKRDIWDTIE